MECSYPFPITIPQPMGLQQQLQVSKTTYLNFRSFQQNWSLGSVTHAPVYWSVDNIIAGEHYFEWRPAGSNLPIISICFSICPCFDFLTPVCHVEESLKFDGTQIVVIFYTIPPTIPPFILKEINKIKELNPFRLDSLVITLRDFFKDLQHPLLSPLTLINFANPLENR
jgi:hypothetical protein